MIPLTDVRLEAADLDAVAETLRSGWLTMGPRTAAFEEAFARQLGCAHAVAVSNCTAALHLAYLAAGVGPGDEVIVPSFTFAATASTVVQCGATPVFADILGRSTSPSIPTTSFGRSRLGPRAVTAMHYAGYPADGRPARVDLAEHGLALIEDSAHAPSATLAGRSSAPGDWPARSACSRTRSSVGEGGMLGH